MPSESSLTAACGPQPGTSRDRSGWKENPVYSRGGSRAGGLGEQSRRERAGGRTGPGCRVRGSVAAPKGLARGSAVWFPSVQVGPSEQTSGSQNGRGPESLPLRLAPGSFSQQAAHRLPRERTRHHLQKRCQERGRRASRSASFAGTFPPASDGGAKPCPFGIGFQLGS